MKIGKCSFVDKCPMFEYFSRYAKMAYLNMYCQGYYQDCERRKLRLAGQTVPKTMLPNGCHLGIDE